MKKNIFFLLLLCTGLSLSAQVDNYSFKFDGSGVINSGFAPKIDNLADYTIQFWVAPKTWTAGALILSRGMGDDRLSVALNTPQSIVLSIGAKQLNITSTAFGVDTWTQVTIRQESGNACVWVNGSKVIDNGGNMPIPASLAELTFGNSFQGRLDEIRIWNKAIDTDYLMWQNTVNFFHPNIESLVLYYKGDQKDCLASAYDYSKNYNAKLTQGVTREIVTDNSFFKYKILSAYTNVTRFFDRNIPRENYLMANDIIILGINTNNKGEAVLNNPNNHGVLSNANGLASYEGRDGVISFNGEGSKMEPGVHAFNPIDGWMPYQYKDKYSIFSWIYIEKWTEGAFIFRKERADDKGLSLRFGSEERKEIILRFDGREYIWNNTKGGTVIEPNKWVHLGIVTAYSGTAFNRCDKLFKISFDGKLRYADTAPTGSRFFPELTDYADVPIVIGENFNGKLDETILLHKEIGTDAGIQNIMEKGYVMRSIDGPVLDEEKSVTVPAYYKYDNIERPGYNCYSMDEFISIMRSAFADRKGYTVRLGIASHDGWQNTMGDKAKNEKMANDIAKIVEETGVDGVETDFEWAYSNPGVTNYSNFIEILKSKLPNKIVTVSPHAVAYNLNANARNSADRFSFQIYTNRNFFEMSNFIGAANSFVKFGYAKNKIILSYGATSSVGSKSGVESGYASLIGYDPRPDVESITLPNGDNYMVCSVNQVKQRAQYTIDNDFPGMMYWDMGNDLPATNDLSLCRSVNFVTASNIDYLYTDDNMPPSSVSTVTQKKNPLSVFFRSNDDTLNVSVLNNESIKEVCIYSIDGQLIDRRIFNDERAEASISLQLFNGCYLVSVVTNNNNRFSSSVLVKC